MKRIPGDGGTDAAPTPRSKGAASPRRSTKQVILEAAAELAAIHGISGASMDEIAERAGVAKGSLYYNFASKDSIFEALLQSAFDDLGEALRTARAGRHGRAAVRQVVDVTLQRLQHNPQVAKLLVAELFRTDRRWISSINFARDNVVREYSEVVTEALQDEGRDPVLPEIIGAGALGAVLVAGLDWLLFHPELSRDAVVESLAQVALRG